MRVKHTKTGYFAPLLLGAAFLGFAPQARAQETVGGGTVASPAQGPAPSFVPPGLSASNLVLVKNWHFGTDGTITSQADLNANFQYHDQHNSIANGSNAYGALIVAPDDANAIFPADVYYYDDDGTHQGRGLGTGQPIEGRDSAPVRQFTTDSIKTFLTPLSQANTYDANGVLTVLPDRHEVGCGSFMPKWFLPAGGSLLGQDIVWETKVRYVTPPYFWFSLWTDGNQWNQGAEHDLIETYGEDYASEGAGTGYGNNNFDGHLWHSNSVNGSDTVNYFTGGWWGQAMSQQGVYPYDATQYHIWTWVYKHDNTYAMYVDGKLVQSGSNYYWTVGAGPAGSPINMDFRFDATWGHLAVKQVDKPLAASALAGAYYEFNYSHVYLSQPYPFNPPTVTLPGTVQAVNYETGGAGVAYNQTFAGGQTLYRPDNSGADYGTALGWTAAGQWYKYKVNVPTAGAYNFSFQAGSPNSGGTFHVEDETGRNLTGSVTVPNTGDYHVYQLATAPQSATLSAGAHTLKWVQDTGGYDLYSMTGVANPTGTVLNGSFEMPALGGGSYQYNPTGGSWTFTGNAGIQANGSAWGAANAPDGSQTAFLQSNPNQGPTLGSLSQSIIFAAAGSYTLSFQAARRPYGGVQPVQVSLDGASQGSPVSPAGLAFSPQSVTLTVSSSGAHTLALTATSSVGDNTTFVDKVALSPVLPAVTVANSSFETPSVGTGSGAYRYNPAGGSWTFAGNSGLQANGSAWGAANAPDGSQTAFLQGYPRQSAAMLGSLSQSISFPAAGTYTLTFQAARRGSQIQPVQVTLDGAAQGAAVTPAGSSFTVQSVTLTVGSAGTHTLGLSATSGTSDSTTFVDQITVH